MACLQAKTFRQIVLNTKYNYNMKELYKNVWMNKIQRERETIHFPDDSRFVWINSMSWLFPDRFLEQ